MPCNCHAVTVDWNSILYCISIYKHTATQFIRLLWAGNIRFCAAYFAACLITWNARTRSQCQIYCWMKEKLKPLAVGWLVGCWCVFCNAFLAFVFLLGCCHGWKRVFQFAILWAMPYSLDYFCLCVCSFQLIFWNQYQNKYNCLMSLFMHEQWEQRKYIEKKREKERETQKTSCNFD